MLDILKKLLGIQGNKIEDHIDFETITAVKESKSKNVDQTFIDGFDMETYTMKPSKKEKAVPPYESVVKDAVSDFIKNTNGYRNKREDKKTVDKVLTELRGCIVIMLDELVQRNDLQFISRSRINGKPIYKYIGNDISKFNLKYEEIVSI